MTTVKYMAKLLDDGINLTGGYVRPPRDNGVLDPRWVPYQLLFSAADKPSPYEPGSPNALSHANYRLYEWYRKQP